MEDFSAHMFQRMNQDVSFDKRDPNHYWEAMNMELVNNGQALSLVDTKGTDLKIELPQVNESLVNASTYSVWTDTATYNFVRSTTIVDPTIRIHNQHNIIGLSSIRNDLYIFVETNLSLNIIFRYTTDGSIVIVYAGYLNMSRNYPLEILPNYETEDVQKLYWVDGFNWFRTLNVAPSNASKIELLPAEFIDIAVPVNMSNPVVISEVVGGNLKAGRIQYAYSQYNRSGQQAALSPLSQMYSIGELSGKGGSPNQSMNVALNVEITGLDTNYDSIRIYSIHYDELGESPEVKLIIDEGSTSENITFTDDGNLFVENSSIEVLIALNNARYKAGTLNTKKNLLFLADYSIDYFDIDFDARAYSYENTTNLAEVTTVEGDPINDITIDLNYDDVPLEHDAINFDPTIYKYTRDLSSTGGTGKFVEYKHVTVDIDSSISGQTFLKRGEKYRIGLVFRDAYGRISPVEWIADTIIPYGESGKGYHVEVTMNEAGRIAAEAAGAVGYSVVMTERNFEDRDIIAQGFVNPTYQVRDGGGQFLYGSIGIKYRPYYINKDITKSDGAALKEAYANDFDFQDNTSGEGFDREVVRRNQICTLYSPDITFRESESLVGTSVNICAYATLDNTEASPVTSSVYELFSLDTGEYSFGKTHNNFKIDANNPTVDSIFDGVGAGIPTYYMGPASAKEDKSYEVFLRRNYIDTVYKIDSDVENVALGESSVLVKSGDIVIVDGDKEVFNDNNIFEFTGGGSGGTATRKSINSKGHDFVALPFLDSVWHTNDPALTDPASAYDKFFDVTPAPVADETRVMPILDLKRGVQNQYGGNSFENRRRNVYIEISSYSEFETSGDTVITTETGDVFISDYTVARLSGEGAINLYAWNPYEYITVQLESYVDCNKRHDGSEDLYSASEDFLRTAKMDDWHKYNTAYSRIPNALIAIPKPFNFQQVVKYDTNIISSDYKFNNEVIDSWTNFLPNETMQLESRFGKIFKLHEWRGELVAFQPRAVASLRILPRVQVQADDGINLQLGTGDILEDFDYITTRSGSLNKWSIMSVNDDVFYYDYYNKSISSLKEGSLSTKYGIHRLTTDFHVTNDSFIVQDNPLLNSGVVVGYDVNKKNIYMTFLGSQPMTVSYNLMAQGFVSRHTFFPTIWTEYNGSYLSTNQTNKLYEHIYEFNNTLDRKLYESNVTSYITILSSKDPIASKRFNNVELDLTGTKKFNKIEAWNDYQTTGEVDLIDGRSGNLRQLYNKWRISLPREANSRNRLQDTKLWVKLIKDDNLKLDEDIVLNNVEIKYVR